jgi:hypothetical protein
MESLYVYQRVFEFYFICKSTLCLWNFIIGSLDVLFIDLHDKITSEA